MLNNVFSARDVPKQIFLLQLNWTKSESQPIQTESINIIIVILIVIDLKSIEVVISNCYTYEIFSII